MERNDIIFLSVCVLLSHTCDSCHRRQEEERKEGEMPARGEMSLGAAGGSGFFPLNGG